MKKLTILFIAILFLTLISCSKKDTINEYKLIVNSSNEDFLLEDLKPKYQVGNKIEVKLGVIYDADIEVYANGEKIKRTHFDSDYWGYTFIMPSEDVILDFKVVSSKIEYLYLDSVYLEVENLKLDDIIMAKIVIENGLSNFKKISYSTDQQDLLNMFNLFKGPMLKATQDEIIHANQKDLGTSTYEIMTIYDTLSITLRGNLLYLDNEYYRLFNQFEDFLNPLPWIENDFYIETPLYASEKFFEFKIPFKTGVKSSIVELDCIVTNSLQELFDTSYSDEYLIDNYVALYFERMEPIISNQLDDISYTELFIENGEIYVTRHYNSNQFVGDSALSNYYELILIPKAWTKILKLPSNFNVNINCKFKSLMSYKKMIEFKDTYREQKLNNIYDDMMYREIYILDSYGEYNECLVATVTYDGYVHTDEEILLTETFRHPLGHYIGIVYDAHYPIWVYKDNKLYTLTEAYNKGYLTIDNLIEISSMQL